MFTVKFLGGAKKSFLNEKITINKSDISVSELLDLLLDLKPSTTSELDTNNLLIAINGVDCSALEGRKSMIKENDIVSIIPVIHGGDPTRIKFEINKKQILVTEIKGQKKIDVAFLDELRKKYPKTQFQAVSSKFILNKYHLRKILELSFTANKNNVLLSNKLEIDILMRFALSSQITTAIEFAGLKQNTNFILIGIGNKQSLEKLSNELKPLSTPMFSKNNTTFIKKYSKITKKHLDSVYSKNPLEDILIEKAAILF